MPGLLQEGVPAGSQWGVWTCAGPKGAAPNWAEPAIAAGSCENRHQLKGPVGLAVAAEGHFPSGLWTRLAKPDQGS